VACAGANHPKARVEEGFLRVLDAHRCPAGAFDEIAGGIRRLWRDRHAVATDERRRMAAEKDRLWGLQKSLALKAAEGVIPDEVAGADRRPAAAGRPSRPGGRPGRRPAVGSAGAAGLRASVRVVAGGVLVGG
jgi:hypothetical protein